MGGDDTKKTYGDIQQRMIEELIRSWGTQKPIVSPPKPLNPLEKFDDIDLMMELISRGYAVHLPLENADKLK